jgi:hypothetical protein
MLPHRQTDTTFNRDLRTCTIEGHSFAQAPRVPLHVQVGVPQGTDQGHRNLPTGQQTTAGQEEEQLPSVVAAESAPHFQFSPDVRSRNPPSTEEEISTLAAVRTTLPLPPTYSPAGVGGEAPPPPPLEQQQQGHEEKEQDQYPISPVEMDLLRLSYHVGESPQCFPPSSDYAPPGGEEQQLPSPAQPSSSGGTEAEAGPQPIETGTVPANEMMSAAGEGGNQTIAKTAGGVSDGSRGAKNHDHAEEEGPPAKKKLKTTAGRKRPSACSTCGHIKSAYPDEHKKQVHSNGSNVGVAHQSSFPVCRHPNPLPQGQNYKRGECFHKCVSCQLYLINSK